MLRPLCAKEVRFCFLTFLSMLMSPERSNSCCGRRVATTADVERAGPVARLVRDDLTYHSDLELLAFQQVIANDSGMMSPPLTTPSWFKWSRPFRLCNWEHGCQRQGLAMRHVRA